MSGIVNVGQMLIPGWSTAESRGRFTDERGIKTWLLNPDPGELDPGCVFTASLVGRLKPGAIWCNTPSPALRRAGNKVSYYRDIRSLCASCKTPTVAQSARTLRIVELNPACRAPGNQKGTWSGALDTPMFQGNGCSITLPGTTNQF